ncbi:hypothetical protein BN1051_00767 [Arthrobacter saudimassiliensis]|uniref:Spermatogenesis-associated protein 20-like TRX domain-containing protein n=1 Tax=Arthrobacter saudimassiliensis TaxID=1461584 RepID=A0A078MJ98_9MICC|nr:hypothetical protein BN1051_00767 [Arthrobacter saudimassiliensis]
MGRRLQDQASAYLRQHADNPVDWWPFGDEAFEEAQRRQVPVFVSVGYAACHWCHVMAHESFEDPETAEYLNRHFVNIKVDREERPDVDAAYMAAVQALTGQGGWPMSVFTLPDGRAFYAGTYYPPRPVQGMPAFRQVLEAVNEAFTARRTETEEAAGRIAAHLAGAQQGNRRLLGPLDMSAFSPEGSAADVSAAALSQAVESLADQEDPAYGGFGQAPKFPPSTVLRFLQLHARADSSTAAVAAGLAGRTLAAMALSGTYDQLEGGFARYAVDRRWAVPHFEKMLYDNAQLVRLYAWWARDAAPADRRLALRTALDTADWMISRLQVSGGGFASSLDADTVIDGRRVEGGTYVWTRSGLEEVLGAEDAGFVAGLMDPESGAVEDGAFTLHFARRPSPEDEERWLRLRPRLARARKARPQPERDGKVVAGWNGLAVAGLADAAAAAADLGDGPAADRLLDAARAAAAYVLDVHVQDGRLLRTSHDGAAQGIEGLLEDYAGLAEGLYALFAATGEVRWYREAEWLLATVEERFLTDGLLRDTAEQTEQLVRAQGTAAAADPLDGPAPSGTALFAGVLLTSAAYTGSARRRAMAESLLTHAALLSVRAPRAVGWAMGVLQAAVAGPQELAVVGSDAAEVAAMLAEARRDGGPGIVIAPRLLDGAQPDAGTAAAADAAVTAGARAVPDVPLLAARGAGDGARAYLCRGMVCARPVDTAEELGELLRGE